MKLNSLVIVLNYQFLTFCYSSLMEELVVPLQEKLEDWKRNTVLIDKDHSKGSTKFSKMYFHYIV